MTKVSATATLLGTAATVQPADRLMHELRQTGGVFGREPEVTVIFAGDGAWTDGRTIGLPALALDGEASEKTTRIMRGFLDHEAGHVRHTNMRAYTAYAKAAHDAGLPVKASVLNALEDIWLEQRVMGDYPGAKANLAFTAASVNEDLLARIADVKVTGADLLNPWRMAAVAITWAGREDYGDPATETCRALLDQIDPKLADAAREWAAKARASKNTRANIKLADAIFEALGEFAPPRPDLPGEESRETWEATEGRKEPEPAPKTGKPGERTDDPGHEGDGTGHTEAEAGDTGDGDEGDGGPDTEVEGEATEAPGKGGEGEPRKGGGTSSPPTDTPSPEDAPLEGTDFSDALLKAAREDGLIPTPDDDEGGETPTRPFSGYRPYTTAYDSFHHRTLAGRTLPGREPAKDFVSDKLQHAAGTRRRHYIARRDELTGSVSVLRRKLERALLAREARQWDGGMRHGRLDPRRLSAAVVSRSETVFRQRTDAPEIDTALQIAVDLSGSMNQCHPPRIEVAADCVIALAEALARTSVAWEVVGYHNPYDMLPPALMRRYGERGVPEGFSRMLPLSLPVFKSFDERLEDAAGPLWAIRAWAQGENVDGEALLMMTRRLVARPERRKVLFVLSDGAPACPGDMSGMYHHLSKVVQDLTRDEGVSVAALGIQSEAVSRFFPIHGVVNSLDELTSSALDMLWTQLLGDDRSGGVRGLRRGARA